MERNLNEILAKYFKPAENDSTKYDTELCKNCGGLCCHAMGCHISPFDLKEISTEFIIRLIDESGCISIDWWDGNPITDDGNRDVHGYFLRMKHKDAKVIDASYGDVCGLLSDTGCPVSFEYRPKGARELIPSAESGCIVGYSKQQCAIDWFQYHDIMEEVYEYYMQKDEVTSHFADVFGTLFESW
jgi:hypothetical protein